MPAAFQFKLPRVTGAHNPKWHLKHGRAMEQQSDRATLWRSDRRYRKYRKKRPKLAGRRSNLAAPAPLSSKQPLYSALGRLKAALLLPLSLWLLRLGCRIDLRQTCHTKWDLLWGAPAAHAIYSNSNKTQATPSRWRHSSGSTSGSRKQCRGKQELRKAAGEGSAVAQHLLALMPADVQLI